MARYDHLPLFKVAYNLCLATYKLTHNFNREYKYTLGEKIKQASQEIIDLVIEINSLPDADKAKKIKILLLNIERLRIYFRIACDLKIITPAALGVNAEQLEAIGKQAGNWGKWAAKKEAKPPREV